MHAFKAMIGCEEGALIALVVQHSAGQSLEALFEALYTDYAEERQQAACVVIRPDVRDRFTPAELAAARTGAGPDSPFMNALRDEYAVPEFAFARLPQMPVLILHHSGDALYLSDNLNPDAAESPFPARNLSEENILAEIRSHELSCLVERSRALLPMIPGSFYLAPSNRLARSFLRVGNIQYSRHAIDAVCFWLLPHMHDCRAILVDTWSISSIAFDLASLVGDIRGTGALPVEMLSEYQDASPERMALAAEALDRLSAELYSGSDEALPDEGDEAEAAKVACLLSATHSGSLVAVLDDLVELSSFPIALSYVAIFQMGAALGIPSLSDISDTPEFRPLDPGEEEGRTIVEVDPRSYFPLTHNDHEMSILVRHAAAAKAFVETFPVPGLISVHRDHRTDGLTRHHAVHIDTLALVRSEKFQLEFAKRLLALDPLPSLIITPKHEAAHELGKLAAALVSGAGTPTQHYEHSNLVFEDAGPNADSDAALRHAIETLDSQGAILILDDAFITGARLTGFQGRLRVMHCRARFHYHVAIARPADMQDWTRAKQMLGWGPPDEAAPYARNSVDATFELCLPNWQERDCPWCVEVRLLDQILQRRESLPTRMDERRQRLRSETARGLVDGIFLQDSASPPMRLESGSIFAPPGVSQAAVFAAVASAIQTRRKVKEADEPLLGPRRHPLSTVIKSTDYLRDVYTDTIVRSSFLRSGTPDELVYAGRREEDQRQLLIADIVASDAAHVSDLGQEIIVAAAVGKGSLSRQATDALASLEEQRELLDLLISSTGEERGSSGD